MHPDLAQLTAGAVPLLALIALLAVAYRHPREWVEALVGVGCAGAAVLATGLPPDAVRSEVSELAPVVLFLVAILVVAECCRAEGLFAAVGARLGRGGTARRRFLLVFVVATATTVVLSLDATVVLLTPVVLATALAAGTSVRPLQLACVRLANSASLLLPVSNLTNLLAAQSLHLSFARFAVLMAPAWLAVLLVEYGGLRWWFRRELATAAVPTSARRPPPPRVPALPLVVVGVMLAGFPVASAVGLEPFWVAGIAAMVLASLAVVRRRTTAAGVVRHAHLSFALFVLCLGVVVAALNRAWLGDTLRLVVPDRATLPALLATAFLGALLANIVNNLPATLILVPLVAPLGAVAVLALLVGVNVGSSMTWTGSLANLLWRRSVVRSGGVVDRRDFRVTGLVVSPAAILVGVVTLVVWDALV